MDIAFKIIATYAVISALLGLAVMVFDSSTDFRHRWTSSAVNILYLPPLALYGMGLVGTLIYAIWH